MSSYIKKETKTEQADITVYFKNAEGYVVPITRKVNKEQAKFDNVLNLMVDNEENGKVAAKNGLLPAVVSGSIKSVQVDGNDCKGKFK